MFIIRITISSKPILLCLELEVILRGLYRYKGIQFLLITWHLNAFSTYISVQIEIRMWTFSIQNKTYGNPYYHRECDDVSFE